MKILKLSLNIFKILFIVLVFLIMIFTIITVKNADRGDKTFLGHNMFIVLSDSMKPEFSAGDIVFCKKTNSNSLNEGDIITFYSSDEGSVIVTHQIEEVIEIDSHKAFITKGLNVEQSDENPVYSFNVIGKYSFSIPKAGLLFQFLRKPIGYITLILIPLVIIICLNIRKFIIEFKIYKKNKLNEIKEKESLLQAEKNKNIQLQEELTKLKEQLNIGNNS